MTREEVIEKLRELAINIGTSRLRGKDIRSVSGLEYYLRIHFNGLASALKEANLEPTDLAEKMSTTNEELLSYVRDLGDRIGKRPTVFDVKRDKKYSDKIFETRFGNIQKAYELATMGLNTPINKASEDIFIDDFPFRPQFWGKATELYIVAELMFRGFNSSLLQVDLGVDVIAIKDNKTFYFQVKSVSFDKISSRTIKITASSFSRTAASNMFYMFVLQRGLKRNILILPYQRIHELIKKELIAVPEEGKEFPISISVKNEIVNIYLPSDKSKVEDVSSYLNDWDVIV